MKIEFVEVQNFKKLKSCRVDFGDRETLFVGANNSGKTSAMDALIVFLKKARRKDIATTDFTISNWLKVDKIGETWLGCLPEEKPDLAKTQWLPVLPSLDVWIGVSDSEIHHVSHLIPTLSWNGGKLGVRLIFEPINLEELYKDFRAAYLAAKTAIGVMEKEAGVADAKSPRLWPQSMSEFLEKKLHSHFATKAYVLDPAKLVDPSDGVARPQNLSVDATPLDIEPFDNLVKVDIINAQRGFSDPKASSSPGAGSLTNQLRSYYDKHLNPSDVPGAEDIEALSAIQDAREKFGEKLTISFKSAIAELEGLGYPGFTDPRILITSRLDLLDGINHESAVQFNVMQDENGEPTLSLPERYNGLGYQNLVSMVFKLIRYRDEWMRKGKAGKKIESEATLIEPLHLVLVEEPEAHLHAQVQQVFIRKAYDVLRNHSELGKKTDFTTQMVVSTHSSHIAHELDLSCLRYFRKKQGKTKTDVPSAAVVNLSQVFGNESDTSKFAARYLKTTHCDLFFADAAILVEGPAERMLVPHFIRNKFPVLDSRYVTVLEIGGSHAHRLKPLMEHLGIVTLIITDLDSIGATGTTAKQQPARGKNYRTGNDTLKTWHPVKSNLDDLLDISFEGKVAESGTVRVAYQAPFPVEYTTAKIEEALPYTFEDALVLSNLKLFREWADSTGLVKKMNVAVSKDTLADASKSMFEALADGKKAEMALELMYLKEPANLTAPLYIEEGLKWVETMVMAKNQEYSVIGDNVVGGQE